MRNESGGLRAKYFAKSDPSHMRVERNAFGEHDEFSFRPHHDQGLQYRCPTCSSIQDSDFLDSMACLNCRWVIPTKAIARDIYVEAENIRVNFNGWSPEILDIISKYNVPVTMSRAGVCKPIGAVAREMTAWHLSALEFHIEKQRINSKIVSELRSTSPSSILSQPPGGFPR